MCSNFGFCEKYWPDLSALGSLAENYLYIDPNTSIIKVGMMAEKILLKIFDYESLVKPEITTSLNMTKLLKAEGLLTVNVEDSLYIIRKARNNAVHSNLNSIEEAKKVLKIAFNLCNWFMVVYGDWKYKPANFLFPDEKRDSSKIKELEEKASESSTNSNSMQTASSELPLEKRIKISEEASKEIIYLEPEDQSLMDDEVLRLEANVLPIINFAMTQNKIRIIPNLYLKNNTSKVLEDLVIKISTSPNFTVPYTKNISFISSNSDIVINDLDIHIDENYLVNLTERVSGYIKISVYIDDTELCNEIFDITLLAYDQWNGLSLYPEILCAFVTPNHPLVGKITSEAIEILNEWTKNPSMDAYQSDDKNRVRMQAAAIYATIQKYNIAYSECPASFGSGQRIRLCETIIQQKIGNCIDLSLMYASCLEAVGIHPLLILKDGHCFLGYWLKDISLSEAISDDQSILTKRVATGVNDIRVVECTCMCYGVNASYEEAEQRGEENLNELDFQYVIDVKCARTLNITPVMSRTIKDNGWVIARSSSKENTITTAPNLLDDLGDEEFDITKDEKEYTKQEQWERKLLDLGLRNRLINMHLSSGLIPILLSSLSELENRLADKESFRLSSKPNEYKLSKLKDDFESISDLGEYKSFICSEFDNNILHTTLTEGELIKSTRNLYRRARTTLEENGANSLFLATGILKWCEPQKSMNPHYAPIQLLPVKLVKKSSSTEYCIELRDEEPQINITLIEKLKQDFHLIIPGLDTLPEDESGIDVNKVLALFRKGVMNQKYWNVLESCYLGIFSFSSFVMWNDLHSRYEEILKNKIVKSLVDQQISWDIDAEENGLNQTYLPITLDASQLSAVTEAAKGRSFILHGPPGTGKSQTITALIANALGNGKRVLFVAEKRAALEVVQDRLAKIGLSPFCLEMHSNKTNKTEILNHLRETEEIRKKGTSHDFSAKLAQLRKVKEDLDQYADELHREHGNGMSLYSSINQYELYSSYPDLKNVRFDDPEKCTYESLENDYAVIQNLISAGKKVGHPCNHPLLRIDLDQYTPQLKEEIEHELVKYEDSIYNFYDALTGMAEILNFADISLKHNCEAIVEVAKKLEVFNDDPIEWARAESPETYFKELRMLVSQELKEQEVLSKLTEHFKVDLLSTDLELDLNENKLLKEFESLTRIQENYLGKCLTSFDILNVKRSDVLGFNYDLFKKIDLLDEFIHLINNLEKAEILSNIGLADISEATRHSTQIITKSYFDSLSDLRENLQEFADKIDHQYYTNNHLIKIATLLNEWELVPREFAKVEKPAIYLSEIEKMANAATQTQLFKAQLDEKWDPQFFDLDSQSLSDEFRSIETSGLFNKTLKFSGFKKRLAIYYRGELEKDVIKNELADFVLYQNNKKTFESLFEKYGNDLGYLYTGESTDWEYIKAFSKEILAKSQEMDTQLNGTEIRCNYAGDKDLIPLTHKILSSYKSAEDNKLQFDEALSVVNKNNPCWINDDFKVCMVMLENPKLAFNWFKYNNLMNKAQSLNMDEEVYRAIYNKDKVKLLGKFEAESIIKEIEDYQELHLKNSKLMSVYGNSLENFRTREGIDWEKIFLEIDIVEKDIINFDTDKKYIPYRIKFAGDPRLNEYFKQILEYKKIYDSEQSNLYDLLNVKESSDESWYETEKKLVGDVYENINNLRDWTIFIKSVKEAEQKGLTPIVENYVHGIRHEDLLNSYKKSYYKALSEQMISKSLVLSDFSGGVFEDKIKRFKDLDQEIKGANQKLIFNNLVDKIPNLEKEATKSNEVIILNKAIQNKGRGRSLRRLFSQLPTLITRLCPCVLMSPLSVAQYLDPHSTVFDLIVFDEASQLQTCKAVGAIARAKNAVIVGDPKQMPPTNFFMNNTYDEDNPDLEDLESILDDCLAIKMPSKHLQWHYRSRHESLIAFSNSRFYENKLLTFPSFNDRESMVKYKKVSGIFDRGKKRTNRIEAEALLEELKRRSIDNSLRNDSVGVVTFNSAQQELIEDLIAEECDKNKKFNDWVNRDVDNSLFVKNLENIQGDERDVILFSVCYGPDTTGKVSMNFGPLNKEGGWRRLNVAISRARKEMIIFSSLVPEQIKLTKSEGVSALREFLEFARSGRLNQISLGINQDKYNLDGILNSVCKELELKGYHCDKLIGHSDYRIDIGVINPSNEEEYVLGILIDGPNYNIAKNTRDREVAQVEILNQLGWQIYRLWSVDWWNDKDKVIAEIMQYLQCTGDKIIRKKSLKDIAQKPILEISNKSNPVTSDGNNIEIDNSVLKSKNKYKSLIEKIEDIGVEMIKNINSSGIVWVIYDDEKSETLEDLLKKSGVRYALERRGAVATNGRKAYRIMMR